MSLDITSKRVAEVSDLPVKNADGSPMLDDENNPVTATVFGPGTKIWSVADALRSRKQLKRTRESNGKYEVALDYADEDDVEFLCAVTKRFNGLRHGAADGDKETVEAVYNDPLLGFIRDHMKVDTKNWENFMKASQTLSNDGPVTQPG